jgi:hypothetical protein
MVSPDPVAYLSTVSPDGRWAVVILPQNPNGVGTTSLAFMSLRGGQSFEVCNDDCSVGPRSFLAAPPFAWSADGTRLFVNLVHFGLGTPRTVVLPYKSDLSPAALWPKGLRLEKDVMANPGAKVVNAPYTFPARMQWPTCRGEPRLKPTCTAFAFPTDADVRRGQSTGPAVP